MKLRLVAVSDTHGRHRKMKVPDGDVFIHAGDITDMGHEPNLVDFNLWLAGLPHRRILCIAGNHDLIFEDDNKRARQLLFNATYLEDEEVIIDGFKFYGAPWQPWCGGLAFNLHEDGLEEKWAKIPDNTDVLITHAPPHLIADTTFRGENIGCKHLLKRLNNLYPKVHFFGHVHYGGGFRKYVGNTLFANVCFDPRVSNIIVVDIDKNGAQVVEEW